jgi:hypothetical protein
MNRRARVRLRGLASLSDPTPASGPIAGGSGAVERRELCDVPIDRAADGVGDAAAPTAVAPELGGEPLNGELVDRGTAVSCGRALRALRALRMARALRLAIALGMAPGTGVE